MEKEKRDKLELEKLRQVTEEIANGDPTLARSNFNGYQGKEPTKQQQQEM